MNTDMPESRWHEVSGQIKIFWSKIDDDDLERIAGKTELLAGMLQQKYGYTQENAELQSSRWMRKHGDAPEDAEYLHPAIRQLISDGGKG